MSERSEIRKEVLKSLKQPLSEHDFKLRGHTFERISEQNLSQQIYLGLDRTGGIRDEHLALGFVITIKEWVTSFYPFIAERNWRTAAACEIRDCNTTLVHHDDKNVWYPISLGTSTLSIILLSRIQAVILPYLESLRTRKDVIKMWRKYGHRIGLPPRHELSIAILMYLNEWEEEGRWMLKRLLKENATNEFYRSTIMRVLESDSIGD